MDINTALDNVIVGDGHIFTLIGSIPLAIKQRITLLWKKKLGLMINRKAFVLKYGCL